jgi:hypothetical protein
MYVRFEFCFTNRKVAILHLAAQNIPDISLQDRIKGAINMDMVQGAKNGKKKRKSLDMVPVGMGDKYGTGQWPLLEQALCKLMYTGAGIENDYLSVVGFDFNARSIATVSHGFSSRRRYRTTDTPEAYLQSATPKSFIFG